MERWGRPEGADGAAAAADPQWFTKAGERIRPAQLELLYERGSRAERPAVLLDCKNQPHRLEAIDQVSQFFGYVLFCSFLSFF